jgi:class 3 adenylate cyclase
LANLFLNILKRVPSLKFSEAEEADYQKGYEQIFLVATRYVTVIAFTLSAILELKALSTPGPDLLPWRVMITLNATILVLGVLFVVSFTQFFRNNIRIIFSIGFAVLFHISLTTFYFSRPEGKAVVSSFTQLILVVVAFGPQGILEKALANIYGIVALTVVKGQTSELTLADSFQFSFLPIVVLLIAYLFEINNRKTYRLRLQLTVEQKRSEKLLKNIYPKPVFERVKNQEEPYFVETFKDVSVLFADIVGFTEFAAKNTAEKVVELLSDVFSRIDASCQKSGATKIKMIGDAYMAVSGIDSNFDNHHLVITDLAYEIREAIKKYAFLKGYNLEVRIGIHCGPVVAGIIGIQTSHFDLWGDTVNLAARLESTSNRGKIRASEAMAKRLEAAHNLEKRVGIAIKGKGTMDTFFVVSPKIN